MNSNGKTKRILALVGMPGAGKTEVIAYLKEKNIPAVRFGEITDKALQEKGLPLTQENERSYRERIRHELGMAVYAVKSKPAIDKLLKSNDYIAIDGLYSWEEYVFLHKEYEGLILVHIFAEPQVRYQRLSSRAVRPLSLKDGRERDISELTGINKGGPIAISDYLLENNGTHEELKGKIDALLQRVGLP